MNILLIQPPTRDFYQTAIRTQPIGLAYVAASLAAHGHEVDLLDCQTQKKRAVPVPPELSYLKEIYPFEDGSPFKLYTGFYHFGLDWTEIGRRIEASKAEVFGISSAFTAYYHEALEVARIIKRWNGKKVVVMGGAHVSCDPLSILESPWVDYVVLGEGELRFPFLLEAIERGKKNRIRAVDGIGYRVGKNTRINPLEHFIENLDDLPYPARSLLPVDRYRTRGRRSTMLVTSRGCPHTCAYCSAHVHMGSAFRARSPENILSEMKTCWERFGIERFDFEDDNLSFEQQRVKSLLNLIIEASRNHTFPEAPGLELTAMNGVSFASLDREILALMKEAGFHTLNLSFVTSAPRVREALGRPGLAADFDTLLGEVARVGLHAIVYAIIGMPGQTLEEMVETLIYLMGKKVLIGPSIYYPVPGTRLFERCRERGVLPSHPSQWRSSGFPIETEDFKRLDLATLFRLVRIINFVKGIMDQGEMQEGVTLRDVQKLLRDKKGETKTGVTWARLLGYFFEERSFFILKKTPGQAFSPVPIESSKKVLEMFFEKGWEEPIFGSRPG